MVKSEKTSLYLLAIVAIVAVVGIVVLLLNNGSNNSSWVTNDISGQAVSVSKTSVASTVSAAKTDSDGDGLTDSKEVLGTNGYTSNPNDEDTDDDYLKDGEEVGVKSTWEDYGVYVTNPREKDTDNDGHYDFYEIITRTDPTDSSSYDSCYDTDNGLDIYEDGVIYMPDNSRTDGMGLVDADRCSNGVTLTASCYNAESNKEEKCTDDAVYETYCSLNEKKLARWYNCPSGTTCSDDACV